MTGWWRPSDGFGPISRPARVCPSHRSRSRRWACQAPDPESPGLLELAQRLEGGCEVSQGRGFVHDAVAPELTGMSCDVLTDLDDVVDVALGVGPARDGQPHQVKRG